MHYRRRERQAKNVLEFEFGYEHFDTSITVLESTGLLWSYIVRQSLNCPLLYTWSMKLRLAQCCKKYTPTWISPVLGFCRNLSNSVYSWLVVDIYTSLNIRKDSYRYTYHPCICTCDIKEKEYSGPCFHRFWVEIYQCTLIQSDAWSSRSST